jgi:hypothetical protein
MNYRIFYGFFFLTLLVACRKDKFTTVPQVEVKSLTPGTVNQGDIIRFRSEFTDKEGDLDSVLVVYKWYNGSTVTKTDTFRYSTETVDLPPKTTDGEIIVEYSYGSFNDPFPILSSVVKDTTSTFGILLIDKEANRSLYAESKPIRLIKP